ncbi:MAG: immunoglobulin domain-containing protein, partial [Verrucomicrobia bacterium]|nr:immunoglobulin domain-containing protein [Verrucomicrobiota bacterium]
SQNATFGGITLTNAGGRDCFVAKYTSAGNVVWATAYGGAGSETTAALRVDNAGNVYVAGSFSGSTQFGTNQFPSQGLNDAFVAKFDTNGTVLWVQQIGGAGDDFGDGVAVDGNGNVYVTGSFQGFVTIGTNNLISQGSDDIFTAKFDSTGNILWARQAGGSASDSPRGIAADQVGNVYITGPFNGSATFNTTSLTSLGGSDSFIAKYDTSGGLIWVKQAGGSQVNFSYKIALDGLNNVHIGGEFSGNFILDNLILNSSGGNDFFIAKLGGTVITAQAPVIVSQPQNAAVAVGANATFSVSATGTQPLGYQWSKNGAPISGAVGNSFTVINVQLTDAGAYSVTVTNSVGAAISAPAFLNVVGPPVILSQPVASQTVSPGSTVTLMVSATGSQPLGYIWRLNGTNLPAPSLPTLTLNNVQPINAGTYDVVVFNSAGVIVSSGSVLNVLPPPAISAQPLAQVVPLGSNAMFSVTANGTGSLTYQWRKNTTNISGANIAVLVVTGAQITDQGLYDVVVTDSIGSVISAPAPLTVLLPPLILQPPQGVTVVGGTNVLFSILAIGNPPPFFQWFRNGTAIPNATNSTLLLTNVTTNIAGLYLVSVTNTAGAAPVVPVSLNVVTSQFVPPPGPPPPNDLRTNGFTLNVAVAPNRIYRVQASTNLLNWVDIGYIAGNGPAVQQFLDNAATNMTRRFYRVVTP